MDERKRKPIRLSGYDYTQNGSYFITICTKNRIEWFGEIKNKNIILNNYGKIVDQQLDWLEQQYNYVNLDCWVIMPNHVHLILDMCSRAGHLGRSRPAPTEQNKIKPLSGLIGAFKTTSSKIIHQNGFNDFSWQRNYYDHIIRNETELNKIREYIFKNPANWEQDRNNIENLLM